MHKSDSQPFVNEQIRKLRINQPSQQKQETQNTRLTTTTTTTAATATKARNHRKEGEHVFFDEKETIIGY